MKNADMPAMPITNDQLASALEIGASGASGLTKREMMAMHIAGHVMQSLNAGAGRGEWDYPSFSDLAQQSVEFADELLKALDK